MDTASTPAISSESNFSAPWMRATLINTRNYVASPGFDSEVVWLKTGNQNDLMNAPLDNKHTPSEKATCTVVGVISSDRLFVDAHGNFNPSFPNSTLETAKAQFQIVSPQTHPEFKTDFQTSLERIENLQRKAATDGPGPEHFIVWDTSKREKAIKFSWPLFEKRTIQYNSTDDEDWSNGYPIGDRFQTMFENIIHKWRVDPMRVYDAQGKLIKTHDLELSLKGSLVLIQFSLRHYAIREKNNNGKASNTFSATATEIQILEPAKKRTPSPYKSLALKGPTFLPQSPSIRRDQISAAISFHPALIAGASTPNPSTTISSEDDNSGPIRELPFTQYADARLLTKVDGKKRAVDEDDDATATEGESPLVEGPAKKKKKQNK